MEPSVVSQDNNSQDNRSVVSLSDDEESQSEVVHLTKYQKELVTKLRVFIPKKQVIKADCTIIFQ